MFDRIILRRWRIRNEETMRPRKQAERIRNTPPTRPAATQCACGTWRTPGQTRTKGATAPQCSR
jgi:hypothetical protein